MPARRFTWPMHSSVYMEIDDRAVFASLSFLDDLREFATTVERLANPAGDRATEPDA
jgi:hypothetical protein